MQSWGVIKRSGSFHGTTTLAHCVVVVGRPFGPPLYMFLPNEGKGEELCIPVVAVNS